MNEETTPTPTPEIRRGWFWAPGTRRAHYYDNDSKALCGRYWLLAFGSLDVREYVDDHHDSPDNCAECKRRVAKKKAS